MNWFFIALLAPVLWSLTVYIDKYLVSKILGDRSVGALLILFGFLQLLFLPIIFLIDSSVFQVDKFVALVLIGNGFIYFLASFSFLLALQSDDASRLAPIWQTIPVFSFFLGYFFLGEKLSQIQFWASALIISGAVLISWEFDKQKSRLKMKNLFLMLASSLTHALNMFLFKYVALTESFWKTSFWEYIGWFIAAVLLFVFIKKYREDFLHIFKTRVVFVAGLNVFNEFINLGAKMVFNFASLLAPLVLVWTANSFQPFFILVYGLILTMFFPKICRENIEKRFVIQKIIAIIIMFVGSVLLFV